MTSAQFIERLKAAAEAKTLYVMGCFGAPMTDKNKTRYIDHHIYNSKYDRQVKILKADSNTFGFDCVCLIKGILWGWRGTTETYGGALYASNGVPDYNADGLFNLCEEISSDFNTILPGEMLHMTDHCGVYIGNGLAVESTPRWNDGVQYTAVLNIGNTPGFNGRTWGHHGKLPWVDYTDSARAEMPSDYAKPAWSAAQKMIGLDGNPIFDGTRPKDYMSRQDVATILYRLGLIK